MCSSSPSPVPPCCPSSEQWSARNTRGLGTILGSVCPHSPSGLQNHGFKLSVSVAPQTSPGIPRLYMLTHSLLVSCSSALKTNFGKIQGTEKHVKQTYENVVSISQTFYRTNDLISQKKTILKSRQGVMQKKPID